MSTTVYQSSVVRTEPVEGGRPNASRIWALPVTLERALLAFLVSFPNGPVVRLSSKLMSCIMK